MKAEPEILEERVEEVLKESPLRKFISGFQITDGEYGGALDFIRVVFDLRENSDISDQDLLTFSEHVENALAPLDDRIASVRFSDGS